MSHAETAQREDKVVTTKETSWTCLVGCQRRGKETWDITVTVGQLDMKWRTTTRTRQCILVIQYYAWDAMRDVKRAWDEQVGGKNERVTLKQPAQIDSLLVDIK